MADSKLDKILLDDGYGNSPIQWSWNEKLILEKWNMGSEEVWKTDSVDDSIQRSIQRAVEHRLSKVLENGIVWDRSASTYKNPMTFSVIGSDTTITIATGGEVIINGRLIEVSTGDITTLSSLSISESYYLLITLTTATSTGDDLNFNKVLQSAWDEQDPTDRDKQVRIATFTTDGSGNIDSVQTFSGDLTGLPNKESIITDHIKDDVIDKTKINSDVAGTHLTQAGDGSLEVSTVPDHDHSGDSGDGGQLTRSFTLTFNAYFPSGSGARTVYAGSDLTGITWEDILDDEEYEIVKGGLFACAMANDNPRTVEFGVYDGSSNFISYSVTLPSSSPYNIWDSTPTISLPVNINKSGLCLVRFTRGGSGNLNDDLYVTGYIVIGIR